MNCLLDLSQNSYGMKCVVGYCDNRRFPYIIILYKEIEGSNGQNMALKCKKNDIKQTQISYFHLILWVSLGFKIYFCLSPIFVFLWRKMMRKLAKNAILELPRLYSQNTLKIYLLQEYCLVWPPIWSKWRFYGSASHYMGRILISYFFAKLWSFVLLMHIIFILNLPFYIKSCHFQLISRLGKLYFFPNF